MASAILFGSIGTLAETSDMQRRAFNLAFAEAGLNWHWEGPAYTEMLKRSGGRDRIARSAAGRGEEVDAGAIHAAKSRIFRDMLAAEGATPRPGVSDVVSAASLADVPLAFATSTDRSNVDALLAALTTTIPSSVFATILDRSQVDAGKPDPEVYARTLDRLGLAPGEVIAVEDNPPGAQAARAAGVRVIAFPGMYHRSHDFGEVAALVDALSPELFGLAAPGV